MTTFYTAWPHLHSTPFNAEDGAKHSSKMFVSTNKTTKPRVHISSDNRHLSLPATTLLCMWVVKEEEGYIHTIKKTGSGKQLS
jgi:hypothetical protein